MTNNPAYPVQSAMILGDIHSQIDAAELGRSVCAIGYTHRRTKEYPLSNGKKLLQIDFQMIEEG